jgi:6-phosphogluconate dehydrogenase
MLHNGIEYSDMQMIAESYFLLKHLGGFSNEESAAAFAEWNKGELNSYLIEITAEILRKKDPETGDGVIDRILDRAGQKGTGKWTAECALDLGMPAMTIAEAVFARCLSALKDERMRGAGILSGPARKIVSDRTAFAEQVRKALYAAKICSYAQGFQLMRAAGKEYGWSLNYGDIALMWRGGCIIRAKFLDDIKRAFAVDAELANLMFDPFFTDALADAQEALRSVVASAVLSGISIPAFYQRAGVL